MADRVVRDEILESDRWLDLPSDTHRLVYTMLLLLVDDYGNCKGGPRRLWRWMHGFTQLKAESDSIKLMSDLQDADMVGRYEIDGIEYWHLHRFRNSRKYWSRKWPRSPFTEIEKKPTKEQDAKNPNPTLTPIEPQLPGGVGVGVGVGELPLPKRKRSVSKSTAEPETPTAQTWTAYSSAYFERYGTEPLRNAQSNSQLKRFVAQVGAAEAPAIATFYLSHYHQRYVDKSHPVGLLLLDAQKLRTEWATGRQVTQTTASKADKRADQHAIYRDLIQEAENAKRKP